MLAETLGARLSSTLQQGTRNFLSFHAGQPYHQNGSQKEAQLLTAEGESGGEDAAAEE